MIRGNTEMGARNYGSGFGMTAECATANASRPQERYICIYAAITRQKIKLCARYFDISFKMICAVTNIIRVVPRDWVEPRDFYALE